MIARFSRGMSLKCCMAYVFDGNWKISRLKCAYDNCRFESEEYGEIQIGCPFTPGVKNYYCPKHKDYNYVFDSSKGPKTYSVISTKIKRHRLSNFINV